METDPLPEQPYGGGDRAKESVKKDDGGRLNGSEGETAGKKEAPSQSGTKSRKRHPPRKKVPYLARQSLEHLSFDTTELFSAIVDGERSFSKVLPIARDAILRSETSLGRCVHKVRLHKLLFELLLKEFASSPEDDQFPALKQSSEEYLGLVDDLGMVSDLVRELEVLAVQGKCEKELMRRVLSYFSLVNPDAFAKIAANLDNRGEAATSAGSHGYQTQHSCPACESDRSPLADHQECTDPKDALERLREWRAAEVASLSLDDWAQYLHRQVLCERNGVESFLRHLENYQTALAGAVREEAKPLQELRERVLEILGITMGSLDTRGDAMAVVESLALSKRHEPLRASLQTLFPPSLVESSIVSVMNKTTKGDTLRAALLEIMMWLCIHPSTVIEKLLYDALLHESQVDLVVQIFKDIPRLGELAEASGRDALALEVFAIIFSDFLDGEYLAQEQNLLSLVDRLTGKKVEPHDKPREVSPLRATDFVHEFICAWGERSAFDAASFRVLKHFLQFTVMGGHTIPAEDLVAIFCIVARFWEERDLSIEDSVNLGLHLEAAQDVSEICSICRDCASAMKDGTDLVTYIQDSRRGLELSWRGMLCGLVFLDGIDNQEGTIDAEYVDRVRRTVWGHVRDSLDMAKRILTMDCIFGDCLTLSHKVNACQSLERGSPCGGGLIERTWQSGWISLMECMGEEPSLKEAKALMHHIILEFLPWCTREEMKHFCFFLFPMTILSEMGRTMAGDEEYLRSSLDVLAGGNTRLKHSFALEVSKAQDIGICILKLDLIESTAKCLLSSRMNNGVNSGSAKQILHQLSSCLSMVCVESVKSACACSVLVLSWHCVNILRACIKCLGKDAANCLKISLLEMIHVIFVPDVATAYLASNMVWAPWEDRFAVMCAECGEHAGVTVLSEVRTALGFGGSSSGDSVCVSKVVQDLVLADADNFEEESVREAIETLTSVGRKHERGASASPKTEESENQEERGQARVAPGVRYTKTFMLEVLEALSKKHTTLPLPENLEEQSLP